MNDVDGLEPWVLCHEEAEYQHHAFSVQTNEEWVNECRIKHGIIVDAVEEIVVEAAE